MPQHTHACAVCPWLKLSHLFLLGMAVCETGAPSAAVWGLTPSPSASSCSISACPFPSSSSPCPSSASGESPAFQGGCAGNRKLLGSRSW